ncbi:MAG: hypothetical protein A2504_08210 [Bdellovibrionales bacterium RIFOXYD12_FULL_39_22]|nr:MAG: hypothetical protein A2385_01435 [Bdellovibrionales bacterium RIFOXYB1_FULL_39_21]OFZ42892.1 MAG: hypothetical protein A2485_10935 [Bdellovibrionales bacterium RIFOXYC12_FULL_39_17]OFZ47448.1 MAG: hypothetical protein A2404_14355 [Bdellovibrionales bacterium RIFOXYC1_FULL_39_130]OFZ75536.1 MAG: hypothetical protein A2560_14505 [Bdellovibrionales bacterium RIFOXYD1_FULL_39_84]OFZ93859.1 MAG: hypothetical protein A2504_08210 [Bdellovibrionales bacterium RIFOXYD12_FULL_39_22]HLE10136.1 HD
MIESNNSDFYDVGLSILKRVKKTLPFDVYIKRAEDKFSKIFNVGDEVDWERIVQYEKKGVNSFYVTKKDYDLYTSFIEKLGQILIQKSATFSAGETTSLLKEMISFAVRDIVAKHSVDQRVVQTASNVVQSCVGSLNDDPQALLRILSLISSKEYVVKHSISVGIFSILLAKGSGIESDSVLNLIGMGAFLHDIGLSQLTFSAEDKESLTAEERKEICRHPALGKQMLDGIRNVRNEVSQIVLQHHEQPNGHGYPNGLRDGEIYPPAKIVAIADSFSSLIENRPYRKAFPPKEALEKMFADGRKFDGALLRAFESILFQKK